MTKKHVRIIVRGPDGREVDMGEWLLSEEQARKAARDRNARILRPQEERKRG